MDMGYLIHPVNKWNMKMIYLGVIISVVMVSLLSIVA